MHDCAAACWQDGPCKLFLWGKSRGPQGNKAGKCYATYTKHTWCPEGCQRDSYDLYSNVSPSPAKYQ
eukprot:COSAG01_NODE_29530_length_635_cov_1.328358_1_plen_66_part_01